MPVFSMITADPRKRESSGTTGIHLAANFETDEANYPQKSKKWYTTAGHFPLWITAVGTAVFIHEELKRTKCRIPSSKLDGRNGRFHP